MPKNLLILHLESITRHSLAIFGSSFPNIRRLMQDAVVFENFFSSATSTLMAITYLLHGNDLEFDTSSEFEGIKPAGNARNLFSILRSAATTRASSASTDSTPSRETRLASWPDDLPPVWATNDFPTLFRRFDELTDAAPFAIYAWDLITHIEHSLALAPFSDSLTDQVAPGLRRGRPCGRRDDGDTRAQGAARQHHDRAVRRPRRRLLDPRLQGRHAPRRRSRIPRSRGHRCAIRDPSLSPATSASLASTIDIAPTCLALLGIEEPGNVAHRGLDLLTQRQEIVFSQNFTANQPDNRRIGVTKSFAATDDTYVLLASSRGLEMYAYRLDPGNHCNLLQFFDLGHDGDLTLRERTDAAPHFKAALTNNPRAVTSIAERFRVLRAALSARIAAKRAHIEASGVEPRFALDPSASRSSPAGPAPRRPRRASRPRCKPRSATRSRCPDMATLATLACPACAT